MSVKIIPEKKVVTCDRCGEEITRSTESASVHYSCVHEWSTDNIHFDFCSSCTDVVINFLNTKINPS